MCGDANQAGAHARCFPKSSRSFAEISPLSSQRPDAGDWVAPLWHTHTAADARDMHTRSRSPCRQFWPVVAGLSLLLSFPLFVALSPLFLYLAAATAIDGWSAPAVVVAAFFLPPLRCASCDPPPAFEDTPAPAPLPSRFVSLLYLCVASPCCLCFSSRVMVIFLGTHSPSPSLHRRVRSATHTQAFGATPTRVVQLGFCLLCCYQRHTHPPPPLIHLTL